MDEEHIFCFDEKMLAEGSWDGKIEEGGYKVNMVIGMRSGIPIILWVRTTSFIVMAK